MTAPTNYIIKGWLYMKKFIMVGMLLLVCSWVRYSVIGTSTINPLDICYVEVETSDNTGTHTTADKHNNMWHLLPTEVQAQEHDELLIMCWYTSDDEPHTHVFNVTNFFRWVSQY